MKLTHRQVSTLMALWEKHPRWSTPADVGGHRNSTHSIVLGQLRNKHLVERAARHTTSRRFLYRLTEEGTRAVTEIQRLVEDGLTPGRDGLTL